MKTSWLSGLIFLLFASIFSAVLGGEEGASVDYAPGDTRLLNYSPFCQALTVAYKSKPSVNIGPSVLYALNTKPMLTIVDSFNFQRSDILNNSHTYYEWDLHFYRGSDLQVSACINGNGSAVHYLIKGKDGFNNWRFLSQMNSVVSNFTIDSNCSSIHFNTAEEDQYFLVFQIIKSDIQVVNITINISFSRTGYSVNNKAPLEQHRFSANGSGSVQTPFDGRNYILLVYGNLSKSPENWNSIASQLITDITCEPRIWLYAVIAVGAVLLLLLCIVCTACCVCVVCRCKRRKSSERSPLLQGWDDVDTDIQQYHPYVDRGSKLDNLTELAIAAPDASNPHIAQFKEDLKSPSFQDNYLSSASPKFSTFKP